MPDLGGADLPPWGEIRPWGKKNWVINMKSILTFESVSYAKKGDVGASGKG